MLYIRLSSVFVLLGIGSGLCAMKTSLKDLTADAILRDMGNIAPKLAQTTEKEEYSETLALVRMRFLNENLRSLWGAIPQIKPLLPRVLSNPLRGVSFLGTSACAVTATKNGKIYWWNTNNIQDVPATPLACRETGHVELSAFAVNRDGTLLASAGAKTVKIWNADASKCLGLFEHEQDVCAVSFNDASTEIVVGGVRGEVWVWDLEDRNGPKASYIHLRLEDKLASLNRILGVRLSSDGKTVFSAGYSNMGQLRPSIKYWDRLTCACTKEIVLDSSAIMGKLGFIDDTRALASFTNGDLLVTNLVLGTTEKVRLPDVKIESSVFSADGRYLLTCCQNKKVVLWHQSKAGYEVVREFEGSGLLMNHCAFRADGSMFLAGSCFGSLDMWSVDQPFNDLTLEEAQALLKKAKVSEGAIDSSQKGK